MSDNIDFNLMGETGSKDIQPAEKKDTPPVDVQETESITNPHEWAKSLDDGIKSSASLHKFKDVGSLAKAYIELEKTYGKSPFPTAKSTEEERIAFFRKAGIPEPEKYDLDLNKYGLPEDIGKQMKEIASKNGIHPSALDSVLKFVQEKSSENNLAMSEQQKALQDAQVASLQKEYGTAFNKYLNLATDVAKQVFTSDELKYIKETGKNNDPIFVKLLMDRAKSMFGEEIIDDEHTAKGFVATPEAIEKRISEILLDKDYNDYSSPRHGTLVQEMEKLFITKSKIS